MNKLCKFYKTLKDKKPLYLYQLIPKNTCSQNRRSSNDIPNFITKHEYFKNYFFPSVIIEWKKLDASITNSKSHSQHSSNPYLSLYAHLQLLYSNAQI